MRSSSTSHSPKSPSLISPLQVMMALNLVCMRYQYAYIKHNKVPFSYICSHSLSQSLCLTLTLTGSVHTFALTLVGFGILVDCLICMALMADNEMVPPGSDVEEEKDYSTDEYVNLIFPLFLVHLCESCSRKS